MGSSGENVAQILSGTDLSKKIQEELVLKVKKLGERIPGFQPGLAIVQVGGREDSNVYIRMKLKSAASLGINAQHLKFPSSITQIELLSQLRKLNGDPMVHGIIVQMPLDCENEIDSHLITDSVSPDKDVDGLHTINEGRVAIGDMSGFVPCTPNGCIELIKRSNVSIGGSQAVVLGRSKIVGTPIAELLKWHNATVTVCHSRTKDIEKEVSRADILVVGIGKAEFVKGSWIKKGAVVIDCGINSIPDATKKSGKRLVGDVAYDEAKLVASYITPVPGGVGPMTVAMLMSNTVISAERYVNKLTMSTWSISTLPLNIKLPIPSDIQISQSQEPKDIGILAQEIGVFPEEVSLYGTKKAKLKLSILDRLKNQGNGKYVVITGITPTPLGEGKSTVTLGLAQAFVAHRKKNSIAVVRQPSQGPLFGIKGGSAGGGYSQIIPMEEFNLHLTGDIHAVTAANNLLAAQLDTRRYHELTQSDASLFKHLVPTINGQQKFSPCQIRRLKKLNIEKEDPSTLTPEEIKKFCRLDIDPDTISWKRVLDLNDRYLRKITIGQSSTEAGHTRETGFSISVASEIMAILALSTSLADMKSRIYSIVVARSKDGAPITADDLGVAGALCILLKDAIEPTLMQTIEGSPVLVHAGPFANIAHGCSSIIADYIGLKLVGPDGYIVTEAGFGSDIGMEKFCNIKSRYSGLSPDAAVLVATIRALKLHGGGPSFRPGAPLHPSYKKEDLTLLKNGLPNLIQHIKNCTAYGIPVIVAINSFETDTEAEFELIKQASIQNGASKVVVTTNWKDGGAGATQLADAVMEACQQESSIKFLYPLGEKLSSKILSIAKTMYGASSVDIPPHVAEKIATIEKQGYGSLPVCVSKTALSLTHDQNIKNAPKDFVLPINDVYASVGAGFIVFVVGEMPSIPGLSTRPSFYDMDLNVETGEIEGLF